MYKFVSGFFAIHVLLLVIKGYRSGCNTSMVGNSIYDKGCHYYLYGSYSSDIRV